MSFIQFQDVHESTRLRGAERPWMLNLIHDTVAGVLLGQGAAGEAAAALHELLPDDHYLLQFPAPQSRETLRWQLEYARAARSFFDDPVVAYRGREVALSALRLNTVMVIGSDPLKLAARLHGQCELNCWVDGPHRTWLANVVEGACSSGLYREGAGWENVAALLRRRDDCPVVVSWSDTFPTMWSAGTAWPPALAPDADPDHLSEAWEQLPAAEQWLHGMTALRARTDDGLEIAPDWAAYRFGHAVSFLDILAEDRTERLDRALGLAPHTNETARG